jgi:hypothetical protein
MSAVGCLRLEGDLKELRFGKQDGMAVAKSVAGCL